MMEEISIGEMSSVRDSPRGEPHGGMQETVRGRGWKIEPLERERGVQGSRCCSRPRNRLSLTCDQLVLARALELLGSRTAALVWEETDVRLGRQGLQGAVSLRRLSYIARVLHPLGQHRRGQCAGL